MTSFFDDLRRAPTPISLKTRSSLISLVRDAQVEMLKVGLGRPLRGDASILSRDLRKYALWLEHAAFVDGHDEESILEVASALYEFSSTLVDLEPTTINMPPLNDLLRSAISSSTSSFRGKATVTSGRIDDHLRNMKYSDTVDRHQLLVSRCIVLYLARDFRRVFSLAEESRELVNQIDSSESQTFNRAQHDRLLLSQTLVDGLQDISFGMLTGELDWIEFGTHRLNNVNDVAVETNQAFFYWLTDRLLEISRKMSSASMHRHLNFIGSPVPRRYRQLLASEGFLEFWSPQLSAIAQGILNTKSEDNFAVSIPTGSGKTLIAELLIMSCLSESDSWVVYVVPSRALVNQVSQDLKRRLRPLGIKIRNMVAGPEQSVAITDEIEMISKGRIVVVLTPEKLDTYLRSASDIFSNCKVLIFDEVHIVGDSTRGALSESLIARFMVVHPQTRLAVLSGVLSNIEDFVSWLGAERTRVVFEARRPTRQTYAVAVRQDPPLAVGDLVQKYDSKLGRKKVNQRVDFAGGLIIVNELDDITGDIEVDIPDVFRGHVTERISGKNRKRDSRESNSPITDHTRQLVEGYAQTPGTILVFFNDVRWVESVAEKTQIPDNNFRMQRNRLADFVSLEIGDGHPLVELCRRGIAYHHARLPASVQGAVEYALGEGWLKVVFATPTLREGVNTSATTVILGGLEFRGGPVPDPMSALAFSNAAGRAGRPRRETSGQIVLVPEELSVASAVDKSKRYILSGADARRVESQLRHLNRSLSEVDRELEKLDVADQRIMLGLHSVGISSAEDLSLFADNTLWALQETDDDEILGFVRNAGATFVAAKSKYGTRLDVAAKSSLSLSSAEFIRQKLLDEESLATRVSDQMFLDLEPLLKLLIYIGLSIDEMSPMIHTKNLDADAHIRPIKCWISGSHYSEILEIGKEEGVFKSSSRVSEAVRYCSDVSNWLSWVAGAAWIIADSEFEVVNPLLGSIPLLVKHGVPSLAGAFIAALGVSDRNAVLQLAVRYGDSSREPTFDSVSEWLDNLDIDSAFPAAEHSMRADLLKKQSFGHLSPDAPYGFASFIATTPIRRGTRVFLIRAENEVSLLVNGIRVGQVTEESFSIISPFLARYGDRVVAITTSSLSMRMSGVLVVLPV